MVRTGRVYRSIFACVCLLTQRTFGKMESTRATEHSSRELLQDLCLRSASGTSRLPLCTSCDLFKRVQLSLLIGASALSVWHPPTLGRTCLREHRQRHVCLLAVSWCRSCCLPLAAQRKAATLLCSSTSKAHECQHASCAQVLNHPRSAPLYRMRRLCASSRPCCAKFRPPSLSVGHFGSSEPGIDTTCSDPVDRKTSAHLLGTVCEAQHGFFCADPSRAPNMWTTAGSRGHPALAMDPVHLRRRCPRSTALPCNTKLVTARLRLEAADISAAMLLRLCRRFETREGWLS
ncbi:hypothetical protein OH77DRAFT_843864 [Trametes cingulata]|nr:hypothetical protein OH77DRAFT_843864 [Trametes cingulata]